ncbi:hypothetical protein CVT24_012131 [Panaeolus cyanescens]|uniref:F-box domain-containing protein n=1 Tax=Panaeolus cyanescens TaxID=181874 RepID=A0A409YYR9_9AGAR|nr:hypothetical protein CVT24_012131 [Panaeolus cyanescens]
MSQAVLIQQNPVFPLEIFSLIVEIIAKSSPHYPSLGSDQLEKLAACSLTCSSLHELCRPQIFRSISVGFNSRSGKKLLRLTGILNAKPIIKTEIVDVFVSFLSSPRDRKLFEQLEKSAHHPATFPAVQRLSIVDGNTFTEGGRIQSRSPGPMPEFAQKFCRELIKSYAKLPTLRSFRNEYNLRAPDIPYIALGCSTLQLTELILVEIYDSDDPKPRSFKVAPLKQLKRLTIEDCSTTFLHILSQSTSISNLTIGGTFDELRSLSIPRCKLETLALYPDDRYEENGLSPAFNLLWKTNRSGFKPISTLRNLSVGVISPGDLLILDEMFADLGQLQSLTINALSYYPKTLDWFSFSDIDGRRHIDKTFPFLTSINFLFWHQPTTTTLDSFASLISTLGNAPHLERVKFTISTVIDKEENPFDDERLFPSLTTIVSSLLQYQALLEVDIHLQFRRGSDLYYSSVLLDDIFLPGLRAKIQHLEQETGVALHASFSPSVCTTLSSWHRERVTHRSAYMVFYPKQFRLSS